jgi:hypothetical protein
MDSPKIGSNDLDMPPPPIAPRVFLFNGDADGIVAQHILGMQLGQPELRITGLKRDIQLLSKLPILDSADLHALDISLRSNEDAIPALLAKENIHLTWYDHHDPGEGITHPRLVQHIHQAPGMCTGAIVNAVCGRRFPLWAAMAAFGDNLPVTAEALAKEGRASLEEVKLIQKTGILLNYNAYGEQPEDVLFQPATLAQEISRFTAAQEFCQQNSIFTPLENQFNSDEAHFHDLKPLIQNPCAMAYLVPAEAWARRFSATWANQTVLENPLQALAIIHLRSDGNYLVSIRAPRGQVRAPSAADLAAEFPTGGGRKLAAGINNLPSDDFNRFLNRFVDFFMA